MSEYCGYVCEVKELRKHPNADRLQLATFFGNTTIVDMTIKEGDVGIYFPVGLALSEKFCRANCLLREKMPMEISVAVILTLSAAILLLLNCWEKRAMDCGCR